MLDVDFDGGVTGGADIDGVNGGEIGGVLGVGAGDGVGKKSLDVLRRSQLGKRERKSRNEIEDHEVEHDGHERIWSCRDD